MRGRARPSSSCNGDIRSHELSPLQQQASDYRGEHESVQCPLICSFHCMKCLSCFYKVHMRDRRRQRANTGLGGTSQSLMQPWSALYSQYITGCGGQLAVRGNIGKWPTSKQRRHVVSNRFFRTPLFPQSTFRVYRPGFNSKGCVFGIGSLFGRRSVCLMERSTFTTRRSATF